MTLKYGTESDYDKLYVFKGNPFPDNYDYDDYIEVIDTVAPVAEYTGNNNSPDTVTFEIDGDTVTFNFTSDGSQNYYGYYAIVEAEGVGDVQTKWTKRIDISDGTFIANPITFAYDGEEHSVSGVVKYDGEKLTNGDDYTISGNKATERGTYTASVEGINEFEGELNAVWKITDVFNVKVDIDGEINNTTYETKSPATITAPDIEGRKFKCWTSNGNIVSWQQTYNFIVLSDVELEAVYVDESEEVIPEPIYTLNANKCQYNGKNAFSFVFDRNITDRYTVSDAGILYTANKTAGYTEDSTIDLTKTDFDFESVFSDPAKCRVFSPDCVLSNNGTIVYNLTIGNSVNNYYYAKGYVTLIDKIDGTVHTVYTDMVAIRYND